MEFVSLHFVPRDLFFKDRWRPANELRRKQTNCSMIYKIFSSIRRPVRNFLQLPGKSLENEREGEGERDAFDLRSSFSSVNNVATRIPLNELVSSSTPSSSSSSSSIKRLEGELPFPSIALQSIRPSTRNAPLHLSLVHDTGLRCVLHFARDVPRADLIVCVLTVTNSNPSDEVTHFQFQANVSPVNLRRRSIALSLLSRSLSLKNIRMKLEDPSSSDLPSYNPILPSQAINQIILLSNPHRVRPTNRSHRTCSPSLSLSWIQEAIRLSYQLSYRSSNELITESGVIDNGFPSSLDVV